MTILELLIVIVILGVLSAVITIAVGRTVAEAAFAACRHDATTAEDAVRSYDVVTGGEPPASLSLLTSSPNGFLHPFSPNPYYSVTVVNGVVLVAYPKTATMTPFNRRTSCFVASTTVSHPTTTTTTVSHPTTGTVYLANGMSVSWSTIVLGSGGGRETLSFTNANPITALSVNIRVAVTPGVSYNSMYATYPGSDIVLDNSSSGSTIVYTYALSGRRTIRASWPNGGTTAQYKGRRTYHPLSGDTWSVTSTSGGITSSASGFF